MSEDESEYEDEEEVDDPESPPDDIDKVEEKYLSSKEISNIDKKIKGLLETIDLELKEKKKKGEFGFRALKRLTKISYDKADWGSIKKYIEQMCTYIPTNSVARILSEKKFVSLFEYISKGNDSNLKSIFENALVVFKDAKHDRLFLRVKQKYANYLFQINDLGATEKHCKELLELFGDDTLRQGDVIVVSSILMQLYHAQKDFKKLKGIYNTVVPQLDNAFVVQKYIGIISELGGKLHLNDREYHAACVDFSRAFKSYESASQTSQGISCLRYIILTSMLDNALINPMAAADMRVHRSEPDIDILAQLIEAFIARDLNTFEGILNNKTKSNLIYKDPLIKQWMEEVIRVVKIEKLRKVIGPFTAVSLPYLAKQLHVDEVYIQSLLALLIADGLVLGKVDQVKNILYLEEKASSTSENLKYNAWKSWAQELNEKTAQLINRNKFR